ncbi:MAG: PEP-CTERM sorting domain-containing protein [Vicinamibacterales bacterium]
MFTRLKVLGIAAAAALLVSAQANAATVIDFSTGLAGEGGSISWNGSNYIGSNIPIGALTVSGAPNNNGVALVNGYATGSGGGHYGTLDFNTATGMISIAGCIPGLSIGSVDGNGNCTQPATLMNGTIQQFDPTSPNGLVRASGVDTKNQDLLIALGLSPNTPFEFFGFSFATNPLSPNGGSSPAISTDIRNTAVPEPATMMLLGTGLLAAFRKRRTASA